MRSRMLMVRSGLAALVVTLAVPVAAQAATATLVAGTLTVTGDATSETFVISDSGADVRATASAGGLGDPDGAGADCTGNGGNTVVCDDAVVNAVVVNGLGGDDSISLTRTDGSGDSFTANGGAGSDNLTTAGSNVSGAVTPTVAPRATP